MGKKTGFAFASLVKTARPLIEKAQAPASAGQELEQQEPAAPEEAQQEGVTKPAKTKPRGRRTLSTRRQAGQTATGERRRRRSLVNKGVLGASETLG